MFPGSLPRIWPTKRQIAQILVESQGWFIDAENPRTLQVFRDQHAALLADREIPDMDVSVIRGHDRTVTSAIAEWVSQQYLDDGSVPLGMRYRSRHGTEWECWAIFPETHVRCLSETPIEPPDPDLKEITDLYGLRFHW